MGFEEAISRDDMVSLEDAMDYWDDEVWNSPSIFRPDEEFCEVYNFLESFQESYLSPVEGGGRY